MPYPVEAIDTILAHTRNADFFRKDRGNACHVLDIIHPLWLCRKQTPHRAEEIKAVALFHWQTCLRSTGWVDGQGFSFDLEEGTIPPPASRACRAPRCGWSIVYLIADLLGIADALGYRPRGVHRPEVAFRNPL